MLFGRKLATVDRMLDIVHNRYITLHLVMLTGWVTDFELALGVAPGHLRMDKNAIASDQALQDLYSKSRVDHFVARL